MEKFIVKYKGMLTLILTAERDKDKVTFEQACQDIHKTFNDKLIECLKEEIGDEADLSLEPIYLTIDEGEEHRSWRSMQ